MSVIRMVNTKFWSDGFVVDKLNPLDRYLFLYFLTNEKTNILGVYEIPLRTISNETGLTPDQVQNMLKRLKGKVEYKNNWICLVNFLKYQNVDNGSVAKGIHNRLQELPENIRKWVEEVREKGKDIDTVSTSGRRVVDESSMTRDELNYNLTRTKLNLTKPIHSEEASQEDKEKSILVGKVIKEMESIDPKNKNYYNNKTQRSAVNFLIETYSFEKVMEMIQILPRIRTLPYMPSITTPCELRDKWQKVIDGVGRIRNAKKEKEEKYPVI